MNLYSGNCLDVLKTLATNSVDSIVTDPPYGIALMNKKWDYDVPSVDIWKECLRVLKPGGQALIACGTRTQHRMAVNIEDAGFEIRDVITWLYSSGFPKSLDISKALDKAAGAEREVIGYGSTHINRPPTKNWKKAAQKMKVGKFKIEGAQTGGQLAAITAPATEAAKQWQGWGTALKPACEFWTLARKPLQGTVAQNVLKHGTGGLNIDGCRVGVEERTYKGMSANKPDVGTFRDDNWVPKNISVTVTGRFPANLILDEEAAAMVGEHARFFYVAKASKAERNAGCEELPRGNNHPTIKPIKLMSYLCRLVTPPKGTVLDPFMGSGSTGVAAKQEGFSFIGIELSEEYLEIAKRRIEHVGFL